MNPVDGQGRDCQQTRPGCRWARRLVLVLLCCGPSIAVADDSPVERPPDSAAWNHTYAKQCFQANSSWNDYSHLYADWAQPPEGTQSCNCFGEPMPDALRGERPTIRILVSSWAAAAIDAYDLPHSMTPVTQHRTGCGAGDSRVSPLPVHTLL